MQKTKKAEKYTFGDSLKKIVEWNVKNDFLKDQISLLEKTKGFPIFAVSAFFVEN